MFNYNKRLQMKQVPLYKKIQMIWTFENYSNHQLVGDTFYLLHQEHKRINTNTTSNNPIILQRPEWGNVYLNSGKKRIEMNEKRINSEYQNNEYFGRTLDDLRNIAEQFSNMLRNKYNININISTAINIVYIFIVDLSYLSYLRELNVMNNLNSKNPTLTYSLSDPLMCVEQGIDIIATDNTGQIVNAYKVLPESAKYKQNDIMKKTIETISQKNAMFEMIFGIKPEFLYASINGFIK